VAGVLQIAFLPLMEFVHNDLSSSEVTPAVHQRRAAVIGHHEVGDTHSTLGRMINRSHHHLLSSQTVPRHPCPTTSPFSPPWLLRPSRSAPVKRRATSGNRLRKRHMRRASLNLAQNRLRIALRLPGPATQRALVL